MPGRFNGAVFWRALATQAAAVALLSLLLIAAIRDQDTFRRLGEVIGPLGWAAACLATWALIGRAGWRLSFGSLVLGAALSGLLTAAIGVGLGLHWLGVICAVALFAAWFGLRARRVAG